LHALMSLKASILYGNRDGKRITLVGEFQARTHIFTLKHWYLRVPFVERAVKDETHLPHQVSRRVRHTLRREDFEKGEKFDPYDKGFDPLSFSRKVKARDAHNKIVGRERRERVSQLTWCGGGCFEFAPPRQLNRSTSFSRA